jgi:nucleotide-binding universal stress UspA family protein
MYNKLVVPLDGSDLAEVALPHVVEIASGCHIAQIFLVSVTEEVKGRVSGAWGKEESATREFHMAPDGRPIPTGSFQIGVVYSSDTKLLKDIPAEVGRMARTAWLYLSKKSDELAQKGLQVEVRVLMGNPAEEIVSFAEEVKADLIIMGSKGKSGMSRWYMGNIAGKVARDTDIPVLLVKPKPGFKETKPKRRGKAT